MLLLLLFIIIVLAFYFVNQSSNKIEANRPKEFIMESKGIYIAGLPDKLSGKDCYITLFENYIEFFFAEDKSTHKMYMQDIKDVRIVSESEIREKVGLGKLIVFGVFALAMKNKKEEYRNLLQIEHNYKGERVTSVYNINYEPNLSKIVNILRDRVNKPI